jgi:hypothetical protein
MTSAFLYILYLYLYLDLNQKAYWSLMLIWNYRLAIEKVWLQVLVVSMAICFTTTVLAPRLTLYFVRLRVTEVNQIGLVFHQIANIKLLCAG